MQIADGHAVFFHYTLTSNEGEVIDSSEGRDPLGYLHGAGNIVPGLEKEMVGKKVGDVFDVVVPPAEGYGEVHAELVQDVPREVFKDAPNELEIGLMFQVDTPNGAQVFTITRLEDDKVTIDGNHALAGETLNFHIEISEVREATESEVSHGHPHGEGGCCG